MYYRAQEEGVVPAVLGMYYKSPGGGNCSCCTRYICTTGPLKEGVVPVVLGMYYRSPGRGSCSSCTRYICTRVYKSVCIYCTLSSGEVSFLFLRQQLNYSSLF